MMMEGSTTTNIKSCTFPYTLLGLTAQSGQSLAFLKVVFPCWYKIKLITLTITKLIHHKNQSILKLNMLALFIDWPRGFVKHKQG